MGKGLPINGDLDSLCSHSVGRKQTRLVTVTGKLFVTKSMPEGIPVGSGGLPVQKKKKNQKLTQKSWNHLKAGRNHFVFISLSSVWNSFFLLVKWLYETSSADCSPHDPLLQKPDHRTLQLISTSLRCSLPCYKVNLANKHLTEVIKKSSC